MYSYGAQVKQLEEKIRLSGGSAQDVLEDWLIEALAMPTDLTIAHKLQKTYVHDPLAFAHDLIIWPEGGGLTEYQDEGFARFGENHFLSMRAPHGTGKTTFASITVLWGVMTAPDVIVPTTASAWRQLTEFLWPEIHKWSRQLRWDKIGREPFRSTELLARALRIGETQKAFAAASNDPAKMEGAHAERVVYIYDEAKTIQTATFDATEGAFAGAGADTRMEAYGIANSTPGEARGRFYEIHQRAKGTEHWDPMHITIDRVIKAGRISAEWVARMAKLWGEEDPRYQNRVLGEFADSDTESTVIPVSWVQRAIEHYNAWQEAGEKITTKEPPVIGADVGRGGDRGAYAPRYKCPVPAQYVDEFGEWGEVIPNIFTSKSRDTMQFTGELVNAGGEDTSYVVDVIGIGSGVVDRLAELGYSVISFSAGAGTKKRDETGVVGFVNVRAAAWWGLRDLLNPANGHFICLPDFSDKYSSLLQELSAAEWWETSNGRIQIKPKDEIRAEIGVSTDLADTIVHAFWNADLEGSLSS